MVRNSVFWKRIYLVIILLSCNFFLVCCNNLCKSLWSFFGCEEEADEQKTGQKEAFSSSVKNKIENSENNINYDKFINTDLIKRELLKKTGLSTGSLLANALFCSAINHSVGKTNIINVAKGKRFIEKEEDPSGWSFTSFNFTLASNNALIILYALDFPSRENLQDNFFLKMNSQDAHAFVFVYDISKKESLGSLEEMISKVREINTNAFFFLLGNKLDLAEDAGQVSREDAKKFANDNGLIFLGECSAKENTYTPDLCGRTCCYNQEELGKNGKKCPDGVVGILKDIAYTIYKHNIQPQISIS